MADKLCVFMGLMDIIAGILIILSLKSFILGIIFGIIMISKGVISFI